MHPPVPDSRDRLVQQKGALFQNLQHTGCSLLRGSIARGDRGVWRARDLQYQGAQFTSEAFTGELKKHGVKISMDGKGRWVDNVYVERLWRSLKYEEVYLYAYQSAREAVTGITNYFDYFNTKRRHQSLDRRTPDAVFYEHNPLAKAA
jgi:transposase InsO family protein